MLTSSFGIADTTLKELRAHSVECEGKAHDLDAFPEGHSETLTLAGVVCTVSIAPHGLINTVLVEPAAGDHAQLIAIMQKLRSIHDVLLMHGVFALPPAPTEENGVSQPLAIYNFLKEADCGINVHTLEHAPHFRVVTERTGKHIFHASDVEMEAGGALHERYGVPAKMKKYKVCVRVDVHINTVVVSTLLNDTPGGVPYSKRHKLAFVRTVTLKPNVAYAMLQLAGVKDGDTILDPFVGSGTIVLEAMEIFKNVKCWGLDRSGAAVKGSTANAEAAGLADRVSFVQGNARTLHKSYDFQFDHIISNFPWGLKTGSTADIKELYRGAIASCWGALKPGGILCCIILHDYVTVNLLRQSGNWDILHARVVKTGGKLPGIIVARKREQDKIFFSLKNDRANLYRYIQNNPKGETAEGEEEEEGNDEEDEVSEKPAKTAEASEGGEKKRGGWDKQREEVRARQAAKGSGKGKGARKGGKKGGKKQDNDEMKD